MSEVRYLAVVTWGGEVSQTFRGPAWELREWLAARAGGTVIRVEAVADGETAARVLLELVLPGTGVSRVPLVMEAEPVVAAAGPEAEAIAFKVVVGSGWASVDIAAAEPVGERWARSVWPAVCAAREAGLAIVARVLATKAAKAGDAKTQKV